MPALYAVAVAVVAGCDAAGPLPEFDQTLTVALLITPVPPPRTGIPADSGLFAVLVTTGTPVRSPYMRADRFEMRRLSDGARFAWRHVPTAQEAIGVLPVGMGGNYFLPRQVSTDGLGSDSLAPGEVYELVVEAGPHRIGGRTRMPGSIEFVRGPTDGDSIVRWRRTTGAGGYHIGDDFFVYAGWKAADDTVFVRNPPPVFPGQPPQASVVRVFALDSNYAALRGNYRAGRAGITGGWGLFGSYTWADGEFAPPSSATSATPR